ncbi:class I SAM-dependent methyltransferase [Lentzea tibetensis]|nr:class I SAM-dependent methyltransferase [Lentzea tibetensis]
MDAKSYITGVFDRAAQTYDKVDVDFFLPMAKELVRRADLKPTDDVLDVGCGRGAALVEAAKTARTVVGTDLAPTMVELTKKDAPANATVRIGDAEEPDFPDRSFDVVTANLVIFFLPDPAKALRNYARILRPGGRVVFNSFAAEDERFAKAVEAMAKFTGYERPPRNPVFDTPESLLELLTGNGFEGRVEELAFESRLKDPEQWLEWMWTHGGRALLEAVPEETMPEACAAAFAEIEKARGPRGDLVLTTRMRFTTGTLATRRTT